MWPEGTTLPALDKGFASLVCWYQGIIPMVVVVVCKSTTKPYIAISLDA